MSILKTFKIIVYVNYLVISIISLIFISNTFLNSAQLYPKTLKKHLFRVNNVEWSPDGKQLVSGSVHGRIILWRYFTKKIKVSINLRRDLKSISWSPDGTKLAVGFKRGSVEILDAETFRRQTKISKLGFSKVISIDWSPDGKFIAIAGHKTKFPMKLIPTVSIYETSKYKEVMTFQGKRGSIKSIDWSPDGKYIAASGLSDNSIIIWNIITSKLEIKLVGHENIVNSIAWNPNGKILASGSDDGTVKVWNTESGVIISTFSLSPEINEIGRSKSIQSVQISQVVTVDASEVNIVIWSPDGIFIASGSNDNTIRIWHAGLGILHRTLNGHTGIIASLAWNPLIDNIASGSGDHTVKIWPLSSNIIVDEIIALNDNKEATIKILSYARKLKGLVTSTSTPNKINNFELRILKGEFETEASYKQRLSEAYSIKHNIERLIPITLEDKIINFDIGKYNAEEETFPLTIKELTGTVFLKVPISDAPEFKSRASNLSATITTQMNLEGGIDIINLVVIDSSINKKYFVLKGETLSFNILRKKNDLAETLSKDLKPPQISILTPSSSRGMKKSLNNNNLTVRGIVTDESGIYEVLVNGVVAQLSSNGNFWADVRLHFGENTINIMAEDMKGNKSTQSISVVRLSAAQPPPTIVREEKFQVPIAAKTVDFKFGKYYALIIANQNYRYKSVSDLDYPIEDAKKIRDVLTDYYTFDKSNVYFLENPDRREILNILIKLRRNLNENDNLLIFYAGHGYWDEDERQGYWLPKNADWDDRSDWLSNSDLRDKIRAIKAKNLLLISDACFSGGIFKVREAFTKPEISIQKIYDLPSRKAITSGALKTVPDKSVFVEYLVKRLKNNQEKYLYSEKLYISMRDAVINNSPTNQTPQFGVIGSAGDEGGDFVFVRKDK